MISVIIPLYNKEKQIAHTLQTVLNQTFQDFEIVIVNDGSTDGSVAEVEKFTDPRIRMIHQTNAGVSAARNRGIEEAKGEYIALLDADDIWYPDFLETQMELATCYSDCEVFAVNYEFHFESGEVQPTIIRGLSFKGEHGRLENYFQVATISHPPICSITIMARKKAFQSIGGFPVGIKSGEDLLTWARLAVRYKIAYSKKVCATYMVEDSHRPHDEVDHVGEALAKLLHEYPGTNHLRQYVSHWHKMRAHTAVLLVKRRYALKECLLALRYNLMNYKVYALLILLMMPKSIILKIKS